MIIRLNTYTGQREYHKGALTTRQAMAIRAITLEWPQAIWHTTHEKELKTGPRGPWTVAWSIDGQVRATTVRSDGTGKTSIPVAGWDARRGLNK